MKSEVDFKSRLIEWGQKNRVEVRFELTDSLFDVQNNPVFISCVKVADVEVGSGKGYSKKESHQMAAKVAIKKLRESNELRETLIEVAKETDPLPSAE
jgi:ribonuclease-3